MATTIKTSDGDVLDRLFHQYYGHVMGTVEAVLEANPGLAVRAQPFLFRALSPNCRIWPPPAPM